MSQEKKPKQIRCIIRHDVGEFEQLAPLDVNGVRYPIVFNKPMNLPPAAFHALENSSYNVERLSLETADASPASDGGGDGAAAGQGGANGGAEPSPNPLDHDGDGKAGGSLPASPPVLKGKTKAELLEIAAAEGVTVDEAATNKIIVAAIEANRAA